MIHCCVFSRLGHWVYVWVRILLFFFFFTCCGVRSRKEGAKLSVALMFVTDSCSGSDGNELNSLSGHLNFSGCYFSSTTGKLWW